MDRCGALHLHSGREACRPMDGERVVDFYYSIGSRYSYLASTQITKLEGETGCRVRWHPVNGPDIRALRGRDPFAGEPLSGQYEWSYRRYDAKCWADYYGVPFREPTSPHFDFRLLVKAATAQSNSVPWSRTVTPCSEPRGSKVSGRSMRTCVTRRRCRWDLHCGNSRRRSWTQPPTRSFVIRRRKRTDGAPSEYRPSSWATGRFGETTAWCWSVTT